MLNRLFDRRPPMPPPSRVDSGTLIFGTLLGLLLGGVTTLLNVPQSGTALKTHILGRFRGAREGMLYRPLVPFNLVVRDAVRDPVQRSIDEGKLAARRLQDKP